MAGALEEQIKKIADKHHPEVGEVLLKLLGRIQGLEEKFPPRAVPEPESDGSE